MNKTCSKCQINKPILEFYLRKRGPRAGQYYSRCKLCMKVRGIAYYHQNHERQLDLAKKRNRRTLIRSMEFLAMAKNKPCSDCGGFYPTWVMDFDHRDPRSKINNVATLRRFHNLKKSI